MYNNAYINPPQSGIASLVASPYADSDVMNVKMTPREVAGLQQLAMSYGATEKDLYDPVTGQPQFSFLKKILPMVAGAFLGPAGYGLSPFAAAATVGLGYGLIEGDLQKGLMAGLGAYSGANITGAFKAAGTPAGEVPKTSSTVTTEAPPAPKFGAVSAKDNILYGGQAPRGFDVDPNVAKNWAASNTPPAGAAAAQAATTVKPPMFDPNTKFGAVAEGARNVFTGQQGAPKQFMDALGGPISQYATFMGAMTPFAEQPKGIDMSSMDEDTFYIPGNFNPLYGTGADQPQRLPGKYYKRTKSGVVPYNPFGPIGMASGGYVDVLEEGPMPRQEVIPYPVPNQNYPLSTVVRANYSPATPRPREVVGGYGPKMDPFTGEEKFADGGEVGVAASKDTKAQMAEDPNVIANRKYVEELNRRAINPTFTPYGSFMSSGLGGTNTPWTGTNPYGGALNTTTGGGQQTTGGGTGDALMNLAAMYGIQQGLGSLTGNAAFQSWLTKMGLKGAGTAAAGAGTAAAGAGGAGAAGAAGAGAAGAGAAGTGAATTGATGAATGAGTAGAGTSGTAAASGLKGGATAAGTAAAAAAALIGAHQAYQGISKGREGQAAAGGALAGAGGAYLAGASGLGGAGLTSLAGFGPVGLAAAALAAIGASMVNTKEYGDVALRNYWNAVDKGRGIGQTDPNELAQGFINFYRTNKNEFAGQAKYGRTGNEDFVYDMTQVINNAVKDGKVNKDVDAATMYKEVVQPWLNSMGEGPKDEKARSIQDFMMTDLINSFMQGKPISNAQVKGDKKFKIVSEKPVYAGVPTTQQQTPAAKDETVRQAMEAYGTQGGFPDAMNPYGQVMQFADGGAIGDDYNFGFAGGGMPEYKAGGKLLDGPGDGMSDSIPAVIRGKGVQRAALADGEFVVPADVVSHLGNGSTKAGAKKLYAMMDRVRQARTGSKRQAPAVKTDRLLPA